MSERPSARWGSQLFVEHGNRRLYQAFLPPSLPEPYRRYRFRCGRAGIPGP
ncbi:CsgE family curli-type amyloid fiber assembly protein [Cupriavidus necator]|uniref:CsgE family curli-type amyloid fiber assembly protein n=1 Tax=Cupriavidus necator TaxID=106590 RepID=UPI0039C0230D